LVPALAQTVFDAGRRRAIPESASANYDAAVATDRQTSLTAFRQVEDNVAPLRVLENESYQQVQALASAKDSLQLFTNRYKGGVGTYLQVMTAQTVRRDSRAWVLFFGGLFGAHMVPKALQI
jgi:outer membrane protein TolC